VFRHILVGTDGSDPATEAVRRAGALADLTGSGLTVATAFGDPGPGPSVGPESEDIAKAILRDARRSLEARPRVGAAAGALATHAERGHPADVLSRLAEAEGFDLVVVGHRGGGGGRFDPSSIPDRVAHRAPSHVLIVETTGASSGRAPPDATAPPFGRILVGTDGSVTAARAVDLAADLARTIGVRLTLATVAANQRAGERILAGVRANYDGAPADGQTDPHAGGVDTKVLVGEPGEQLARFAVTEGFDLIVVGNRGMTGIRRFLGSVPKDVARLAEVSVLIAKTT
jgi:nucleotide-binding universal stress UspA family protein